MYYDPSRSRILVYRAGSVLAATSDIVLDIGILTYVKSRKQKNKTDFYPTPVACRQPSPEGVCSILMHRKSRGDGRARVTCKVRTKSPERSFCGRPSAVTIRTPSGRPGARSPNRPLSKRDSSGRGSPRRH